MSSGAPSGGAPLIGVAGLGYWGPNLARNLNALGSCELSWCCDPNEAARERWKAAFPDARFTGSLAEMLADPDLDAVVVATPVPLHAPVARQVLEAGKHCFVEKPLAHTEPEAEQLAALAAERGLTLMVGHLLEFHPAVERLRELVRGGELGDPHYIYSQRVNLGKLRADENALWSLGAHDISVLLALADAEPVEVSAQGAAYVRSGVEDVVFCMLRFDSGLLGHHHLSWLDPHKARKFTVVGSRRMATFDDMDMERKLTLYDKGFDPDHRSYGEYITRAGDISSPHISNAEPLRLECEHFVDCLRTGANPRSDGASGVRVVRVLAALQRSLDQGGRAVTLGRG
ncbi:MAG: Gfo/Idh/MocA family protein [Solirubrobacterales bacterium]